MCALTLCLTLVLTLHTDCTPTVHRVDVNCVLTAAVAIPQCAAASTAIVLRFITHHCHSATVQQWAAGASLGGEYTHHPRPNGGPPSDGTPPPPARRMLYSRTSTSPKEQVRFGRRSGVAATLSGAWQQLSGEWSGGVGLNELTFRLFDIGAGGTAPRPSAHATGSTSQVSITLFSTTATTVWGFFGRMDSSGF